MQVKGVERWLHGRVCTESHAHLEIVLGLGCMVKGLETWKDIKPSDDVTTYCVVQCGGH